MNNLLDDTDELEDRPMRGRDREITLGTTTILLIFFGLAVYGAVLFGFGYSLGGKHNGAPVAIAGAPATSYGGITIKPAPGSPVGAASVEKPPANTETATVPLTQPTPAKVDATTPKPEAETATADDFSIKPKATNVAVAAPVAATPAAAAPQVVPGGTVVVQVAALSQQSDAELVASTLKRRGYVVNILAEPDKLFHVQVGPFATRKDAETMKAKLLSDGFNAYIK